MTELPFKVGYGRPPVHSRFQKGQSGNPGGRTRAEIQARANPEKMLKLHFEMALTEWLNADEEALRKVKPKKVIESLARQLALQALDGGIAAQKLVLLTLERGAGDVPAAVAEEAPEEPAAEPVGMEDCRELLGDRFEEFRTRYDRAVAAGSTEDLIALAEDFDEAGEFPEADGVTGWKL